ncbi:ferredoxin-2 [Quercus suber]|uniref:Ferredoxin-2 n=1 Tax=Quercus suber TaxID=58331 RepID=A0AAW0LAC3_QUESU
MLIVLEFFVLRLIVSGLVNWVCLDLEKKMKNEVHVLGWRLEDNDACSAECEVNIAKNWLNMLPPCTYDEEYILKRSSRAHVMNMHSRLACQVVLTPELQGMIVTIPKPQPWDIP